MRRPNDARNELQAVRDETILDFEAFIDAPLSLFVLSFDELTELYLKLDKACTKLSNALAENYSESAYHLWNETWFALSDVYDEMSIPFEDHMS